MKEHPINDLMTTVMGNIKEMVDVNTIIGEAVETSDGTIIIPVSKVGFGFAAGGSDFTTQPKKEDDSLFGGGSGAGVSISPVGFLVVGKEQIKLIPVTSTNTTVDKLLDYVPTIFDKVNNIISKNKSKQEEE